MSMCASDYNREFVALFAAHNRGIYKYILTLMAGDDATQEVFQETSVVLWQKFGEFQQGSSFLAWSCRVAYFEVLKYRQTQRRDRLRFDSQLLHTIAQEWSASESVLRARQAVLPDCMDKLPMSDRELVEQRYGKEETIFKFSQRIGRSANTLYKALERIRRTLMKCIEESLARSDGGSRTDHERGHS